MIKSLIILMPLKKNGFSRKGGAVKYKPRSSERGNFLILSFKKSLPFAEPFRLIGKNLRSNPTGMELLHRLSVFRRQISKVELYIGVYLPFSSIVLAK